MTTKAKPKVKQKQVEIGRFALSDSDSLVATLIGDEKLDLRVWVHSPKYEGWTKRGIRLFLFDGNWEEFKKLIDKIDEAYEKL